MNKRRNIFLTLSLLALLVAACGGRPASDGRGPLSHRDSIRIAHRLHRDSVRALRRNPEAYRDSLKEARRLEALRPKLVDTLQYRALMDSLANGDTSGRWPAKAPYPYEGAILPYKRVVAYYGNLYSKQMGVLGEYPPDTLWQMLRREMAAWQKADPSTPVVPAIHYICTTAQGSPGRDSLWRLRMPRKQIDSALKIAAMGDALVFLDIQVALSNVQAEVPVIEEYLKLPHVHLAIDPEFMMHGGKRPGSVIGSMDASQINWCAKYLQRIVRENNLPPKMLVIHRFTTSMVKNSSEIKPLPEVQIIMDMDGWGSPRLKRSTYNWCIYREPVQFTGFKLFYKNDLKQEPHRLLTPEEVLKLSPKPIYIQYQ